MEYGDRFSKMSRQNRKIKIHILLSYYVKHKSMFVNNVLINFQSL